MDSQLGSKLRYVPALDGLRALAVLAVVAYHMKMPWAVGGLLGVTVFFVLSGYLITSLLLIEYDSTRTINLPRFWLHRIRRLVPAIVLVIVCTAVLCTIFNHSLLTKMRGDILPSLLFYNNWWQIFHDVSYFDALGAPSPLTHFWSLAIEEQFYLVWPVVLFFCLKKGVKKRTLGTATIIVAVLSAIEMAVLFDPSVDPSRVYYGTDTRAFSLLIGAALAFVLSPRLLEATGNEQVSIYTKTVFDLTGTVALVALLALIVFVSGYSTAMYRGGILLASILTAVIIAAVLYPATTLGRVAGFSPFVWIGKRSYGIYLWHYPLLLLMNSRVSTSETPWWLLVIQAAVVFACAALSYRFVEQPIRQGAIGRFVKGMRSGAISLPDWLHRHVYPCAGATLLVIVAIAGLVLVPPTSAVENTDLLQQEAPQRSRNLEVLTDPPASDSASSDSAASDSASPDSATSEASQDTPEKPRLDLLMIGDSVSVDIVSGFEETFPNGAIDAMKNRYFVAAKDIYDGYASQYDIGIVVIALGTNGPVDDEQIDALVADVGSDKQIFFVNTRFTTDDWMGSTNAALANAADRYANVSLIDWYGASAGHDAYFDGDGTHLTVKGAAAYLDLVNTAVSPLISVKSLLSADNGGGESPTT